ERTQTEIQNNMNCEVSSGTGLEAAYHFDQGVAGGDNSAITTLTDASGNARTGTLTNFALNGSTSNFITSGAIVPTSQYRSAASGTWSNASTWETLVGDCWVTANQAPDYNDESITIRTGHTVTINQSVTIDQANIESSGELDVAAGTLTIHDGTGSDLVDNGN